MRLLDYLDRGCIGVGLPSAGKRETLEMLVDLVIAGGLARDRARLMEALRQREEVVSTGVGNGVAIPHADLAEIESPRLALGIFPDGVDFDALDEEPVYIAFVLLGTPRTPGLHMKILARIARLSKDPEFSPGLRNAKSPDEVLAVLDAIESRH